MRIFPFLLTFLLSISVQGQRKDITVKRTLKLMGTRFEITVVAPDESVGNTHIDEAVAEIKRIEQLISSWNETSETTKINQNAGVKPVKVSPELFGLIQRAKKISEITDGAFDISYASMDNIWKFDGSMKKLPSEAQMRRSVSKIGHEKIVLNTQEQTVFLNEPGMKIGFGAIGKGYAADRAKALLISRKVKGGIINASGDLTTWGTKVTGEKWLVGITNPLDKDKVFSWLPIVESSVATSGNYEKYNIINGKKYSHIIDPRTGFPTSGINGVSIFASKAELCDALATAVFIMGKDSGLHLIDQLDGVEAVVITSEGKILKSSGIEFRKNE